MPARYTVAVDGVTYDVVASGRAKACEAAVRDILVILPQSVSHLHDLRQNA
jgi:hypothetical protein